MFKKPEFLGQENIIGKEKVIISLSEIGVDCKNRLSFFQEGSAAKNFEALIDLLPDHADRMMFCSDDKHPDDLILGHINQLAARAVAKGYDVFDVLKAACINPVVHYGLEVGLLRKGDPADFILVHDLKNFKVQATYIDGKLVAEAGESFIQSRPSEIINNFSTEKKSPIDFQLKAEGDHIQVIKSDRFVR